jgi:hypothetical protein
MRTCEFLRMDYHLNGKSNLFGFPQEFPQRAFRKNQVLSSQLTGFPADYQPKLRVHMGVTNT